MLNQQPNGQTAQVQDKSKAGTTNKRRKIVTELQLISSKSQV
jgi:hypothetical protein